MKINYSDPDYVSRKDTSTELLEIFRESIHFMVVEGMHIILKFNDRNNQCG